MRDNAADRFMEENSDYLNRFSPKLNYTPVKRDEEGTEKVDEVIEYINSNILRDINLNDKKREGACLSQNFNSRGIEVRTKDSRLHIKQINDTFIIYVGQDNKGAVNLNLELITNRAYKILSYFIDNKSTSVSYSQKNEKSTTLKVKVETKELGIHRKRFKLNLVGQPKRSVTIPFLIIFNNK